MIVLSVSATVGSSSTAYSGDRTLDLLCGADNVEDMVVLPGTDWIIGSGIGDNFFQRGALHVINQENLTVETVPLDLSPSLHARAPFDKCPAPPAGNLLSAHGLGLQKHKKGSYNLFVMNHGGRESIEVFRIVPTKQRPNFTWIGCIVPPPNAMGNSIAVSSEGVVVLSAFTVADHPLPTMADLSKAVSDHKPKGPNESRFQALKGALFTWDHNRGWEQLPNSELNGNNGLELSRDGRWVFVSSWFDRRVVRVALKKGLSESRSISVDFMPDNLRWSFDGKLIATGQDVADPREVFACTKSAGPGCPTAYAVAQIDPESLTSETIFRAKGIPEFGTATIGLKTARGLWLGSVRSPCIGHVNTER